jgi:hypothetical protein
MAQKAEIKLGHIAQSALSLLRRNPQGLSMRKMRELLGAQETQEHFNRRVREIRKYYVLTRQKVSGADVYILGKLKSKPASDSGAISERLRAEIFHAAHKRCEMCGSSIQHDKIKLQIDHRLPQAWGGKTERANLWAICEACNRGKKHFFSSFDDDEMKKVLGYRSVHERLAHMLRLRRKKPVPAYLLQFVANALNQQEDWQKRLRELRHPVIGLKIDVFKKKGKKGVESFYTLQNWRAFPESYKRKMREYDLARKIKRP